MTKYGMAYHTIRYHQNQAITHVRYNGNRDVFQRLKLAPSVSGHSAEA